MTWAVYLFALLFFLFSLWQLRSTQQLLQCWETPTCQNWSITHITKSFVPGANSSSFLSLFFCISHSYIWGVMECSHRSKDSMCSTIDSFCLCLTGPQHLQDPLDTLGGPVLSLLFASLLYTHINFLTHICTHWGILLGQQTPSYSKRGEL